MAPSSPLPTPVLLVTFNRPDLTREVLAAIREARPERLFVASDGPRPNVESDAAKVAATRAIVEEMVDWPCQVERRFSDTNQGCGIGVSSAISWFFEHVDAGIILEDETVPSRSFFLFCSELLERYRDDERMGMISGTNHTGHSPTGSSYTFSRNRGCWGWATWARAWQHMDQAMTWRQRPDADRVIADMGITGRHIPHWRRALDAIDEGRVDTWDWQWYFSMAASRLVAIVPEANLVSNIGFRNDATHTRGAADERFTRRFELRFPLKHPPEVRVDDAFDRAFEEFAMPTPAGRVIRRVKRELVPLLRSLRKRIQNASFDPFPARPEMYLRYGYAHLDRDVALANLTDLSELLRSAGIPHWMFFGTLLGATRDGDLIEWDEDVDLAILGEHLLLVLDETFLTALEARGFVLARWRGGLISFIRENQYIDLYAFREGSRGTRTWGSFRIPKRFFSTDTQATVRGVDLPAPADPEDLLRKWYGQDWRTPVRGRPADSLLRCARARISRLLK